METASALSAGSGAPWSTGDWLVVAVALISLVSMFRVLVNSSDVAIDSCRRWGQTSTIFAIVALWAPSWSQLAGDVRWLIVFSAVDCWLLYALHARRAFPRATALSRRGRVVTRPLAQARRPISRQTRPR